MTDHTNQEETHHDDQESEIELPPEMPPPLYLDPPLTLEAYDSDSDSVPLPPMGPISNLTLPTLNENGGATANPVPANEMTTPSTSSPKRPWSAMESNGSTSGDSNNIPTKKCKICNLETCIERYHLEKVNEMVRKNNELKKKINKANELNARLDAIIQDLDTQCPMNKDIIRALLRSEPEDIDLNFDGDE